MHPAGNKSNTSRTGKLFFVSATRYFILKDGVYHPIYRQKFLFDILKVNRQAIVKHLKSQGIRYKDDQEKAIIAIAQYFNQLRK